MKWFLSIFLACTLLTYGSEKEERGVELCQFTHHIFKMLSEESQNRLQNAPSSGSQLTDLESFKEDRSPEIAALADHFLTSFNGGDGEELGEAVTKLGRLLKCSVEQEAYRSKTSFALHKDHIESQLSLMESLLGERLPIGDQINYHKMMIESLASQEYDLALYSYLKIAETRCERN